MIVVVVVFAIVCVFALVVVFVVHCEEEAEEHEAEVPEVEDDGS